MKKLISICSLLITFGCIDRVFYDVKIPEVFEVSIDGFISDQPPPYRVNVQRTFDTESNENLRAGVSARVTLIDAEGHSEEFTQVVSGVYETATNGIQGVVGGVYKIKVELDDGRIYESKPDTLYAGGTMDDVSWKFNSRPFVNGFQYYFEIYGDASTHEDLSKTHFMWRNKTTFKSTSRPEFEPGNCYRIATEAKCNFVHPCTGLKNVGTDAMPKFERIGPCTCCTCWYDAYNPEVILNDHVVSVDGDFPEVVVDRIVLDGWYMMYKMRIETSIQSLSLQSYRFWKGIRDQYAANSNIFQPITGKIPGNIQEVSSTGLQARGIFYATSVNSKVYYIRRYDIDERIIPDARTFLSGRTPCFNLFPNFHLTQPSYWEE